VPFVVVTNAITFTFEIEPIEDTVRLTVIHGNFKTDMTMVGKVSGGWPRVLTSMKSTTSDESDIRRLIEAWAAAVRAKNLAGILADHSPDIVMFDVPPPFQSGGIEAYRKTWDVFFNWFQDSGVFNIEEMNITTGQDVAFVTALMRCAGTEPTGERTELPFRLTVDLKKINGRWTVMHEHHSVPAE